MRGILLAGGVGSRLWPATAVISKQLLPVAGRPMCLYPLCTLMEAGIREVCVITMPHETERFIRLMADGHQWGMEIQYMKQVEPTGIAEAFLIAQEFIGSDPVALILGDNLFIGLPHALRDPCPIAQIVLARTMHPEKYGVLITNMGGRKSRIVEKPRRSPPTGFAITGFYIFPHGKVAVEITSTLKPSKRGELEITDLLSEYLRRGQIKVHHLHQSAVWLDCGTPEDLHEASALVMAMEKRTGDILGSPELAALRQGWISQGQFNSLVEAMPACAYRDSLCQSQNRNHRSSPKR